MAERISHWVLWTVLLIHVLPGLGGQKQPDPQAASVAYEADVEATIGGRTFKAALTYDGGHFRQVTRFPGTPQNVPPGYVELYDGSSPPVVWEGDLHLKTFRPDGWSIREALAREAARDGVEAVRQRYGIPADRRIRPRPNNTPPRPMYGIPAARDAFARGRWRPLGNETIAGHVCRIYESQSNGRQTGSPTSEQIWVEPRSGLILKREVGWAAPPGSPAPPRSEEYIVRRLKLLDHVPQERFRIPAGFTVVIPRLFKNTTLPAGVRREAATGPWAATGIAYK